jgi:hypothetical protein
MVKSSKKTPYVRPATCRVLIGDENIANGANNQHFTASNCQRVSFKDCVPSHKTIHKNEIEKRINNSPDIQSLILYLSSINLCFGNKKLVFFFK